MRRVGLIFYRDDDSGIAKISVIDLYTGIYLVQDDYVDLYQGDQSSVAGNYEEFIYWVTLPYNDVNRYQWSVVHSGYSNPSSLGVRASINYNGYMMEEDYSINAYVGKSLILFDTSNSMQYTFSLSGYEYSEESLSYIAVKAALKQLYITVPFVGDGTTKVFTVGGLSLKCYKFVRWSVDGGTTWNEPYNIAMTWGSNSLHDDEIIDEGIFSVEFAEAPEEDSSILFDVVPIFDQVRVELCINQPSDSSYYDYNIPVSVLDYSIEFIK